MAANMLMPHFRDKDLKHPGAASFSDGKAAPPIEIPELGNAFAYGLLWRFPNGTSLTPFSLADLNGRLL